MFAIRPVTTQELPLAAAATRGKSRQLPTSVMDPPRLRLQVLLPSPTSSRLNAGINVKHTTPLNALWSC